MAGPHAYSHQIRNIISVSTGLYSLSRAAMSSQPRCSQMRHGGNEPCATCVLHSLGGTTFRGRILISVWMRATRSFFASNEHSIRSLPWEICLSALSAINDVFLNSL